MPKDQSNVKRRNSPRPTTKTPTIANGEVLALAETAAYLRVTEDEVCRLIREQGLPGRKLGNEWRFLKTALEDWLRSPPNKKEALLMQIGAFQDDPDLGAMLEEIHKQRGRPVPEAD